MSFAVRLQIAASERQHARIGMCVTANFAHQVERQLPVLDRSVIQFADKVDRYLILAGTRYRKADRVPVTMLRKVRAIGCVTKIAEFSRMFVGCRQLLS